MSKLEEEIADGSSLAEMTSTPKNIAKEHREDEHRLLENRDIEQARRTPHTDAQGSARTLARVPGRPLRSRPADGHEGVRRSLGQNPKDAEGLTASGPDFQGRRARCRRTFTRCWGDPSHRPTRPSLCVVVDETSSSRRLFQHPFYTHSSLCRPPLITWCSNCGAWQSYQSR